MKQFIALIAIAALAGTGCHRPDETVVTGPNGERITASRDAGHITVTDDKGNKYETGSGVSETDLGLPFYPGSEDKVGASMKVDAGPVHSVISTRSTKD